MKNKSEGWKNKLKGYRTSIEAYKVWSEIYGHPVGTKKLTYKISFQLFISYKLEDQRLHF